MPSSTRPLQSSSTPLQTSRRTERRLTHSPHSVPDSSPFATRRQRCSPQLPQFRSSPGEQIGADSAPRDTSADARPGAPPLCIAGASSAGASPSSWLVVEEHATSDVARTNLHANFMVSVRANAGPRRKAQQPGWIVDASRQSAGTGGGALPRKNRGATSQDERRQTSAHPRALACATFGQTVAAASPIAPLGRAAANKAQAARALRDAFSPTARKTLRARRAGVAVAPVLR